MFTFENVPIVWMSPNGKDFLKYLQWNQEWYCLSTDHKHEFLNPFLALTGFASIDKYNTTMLSLKNTKINKTVNGSTFFVLSENVEEFKLN